MDETTRQFISVTVGDEEYGLDVMAIREIKGWTEATHLPDTPAYVRGVIDLRGAVIPILDLRARFGRGTTEPTPRHVIVVLSLEGRGIGLLVDAVADILTVRADAIQPVPDLGGSAEGKLLSGIISADGRMVALLDLERLRDTDIPAAA